MKFFSSMEMDEKNPIVKQSNCKETNQEFQNDKLLSALFMINHLTDLNNDVNHHQLSAINNWNSTTFFERKSK